MLKIGLTGGIGSGKSSVAALLRERGFVVVDADRIARDVLQPGSDALKEVAAAFGDDLVDASGALNRKLLAQRAFVSEEQTQKLNSITHPAIRKESSRQFDAAEAEGARVAVYDMPLLVELGLHRQMDFTVVVDVNEEERVRRLVQLRGLSEADARSRIARQIDDDDRLAAADYVIDNNGPLSELAPQVDALVDYVERELLQHQR
ncbi:MULTISPECIES: dephospho-CoA kinase [Corynebacterium]|uniref:Dephospho-CoA kinase n=1 Tax=Corynebacterium lipophilum TaxID=2804918 RepID=A0AAW5I0K9_9CORY|nr:MULTISPECIES: dephospho-CoA kinase [Corynebacterium]MCO6395262.1 dephospho-CoA kinase [Corynebacterium lipophilum]MCZ2117969.1 dephospho-CoA kinase [Corynebacterium lipophilum]OIR40467.1 dephospho-CoA kinase [Corynebacterium sp. NML120713]